MHSVSHQGVQVSEQQEFRQSFFREQNSRALLANVKVSILAYRGDVLDPQWMDTEPGKPMAKSDQYTSMTSGLQIAARFTTLCNVIGDTSTIAHSLRPQRAPGGDDYYCLDFDVVLLFGLTELNAQISWTDDMVRLLIIPSSNASLT